MTYWYRHHVGSIRHSQSWRRSLLRGFTRSHFTLGVAQHRCPPLQRNVIHLLCFSQVCAQARCFRIFLVALLLVSRSLRRLSLFEKRLNFILRHFKNKADSRLRRHHQAHSSRLLLHNYAFKPTAGEVTDPSPLRAGPFPASCSRALAAALRGFRLRGG